MRDPTKAKIFFKTLEDIWAKNPELRFCQILANAIQESAMYYIEDQTALDLLCKFYKVDEGKPDRSLIEEIRKGEIENGS
jgi:uncharacterized protein YihD (DUF1040 family)